MRLIDADEAKKALTGWDTDPTDEEIEYAIDHLPTVDAMEVVRCKDCKYWRDTWVGPDGKSEHGYCHMEEADDVVVGRWSDDFCSYGERRNDDQT